MSADREMEVGFVFLGTGGGSPSLQTRTLPVPNPLESVTEVLSPPMPVESEILKYTNIYMHTVPVQI